MRYGDVGYLDEWGRAWSCGDPTRLLPFYAGDARYRDVGSDLTFHGHAEIERFYRFMLKFAPDSKIVFDDAHGDATGFAAHWSWSGTASGPLAVAGVVYPASGTRFEVPGVAYCRLAADGTLASHEDYYDMHAIVRLITADPAQESSAA